MPRSLYSRWDGTQDEFSLDADEALEELSKYLMEGLDLEQSLDWMRYHGFDLAGMEFRVMGIEELLRELRQRARDEMAGVNLDEAFDEPRRQLDEILDRAARGILRGRHMHLAVVE